MKEQFCILIKSSKTCKRATNSGDTRILSSYVGGPVGLHLVDGDKNPETCLFPFPDPSQVLGVVNKKGPLEL
jgi:hypothetical protein